MICLVKKLEKMFSVNWIILISDVKKKRFLRHQWMPPKGTSIQIGYPGQNRGN